MNVARHCYHGNANPSDPPTFTTENIPVIQKKFKEVKPAYTDNTTTPVMMKLG